MIKAIIFDLDGTVTNSELLHRQAFNILLKKYGLSITNKQWQNIFVGAGSRFIAQWYIRKYKLPEDLDDFVDKRRRKYQELLKKHPLKPISGFMKFYNALKRQGFKVAIASSGHRSNVLASLRAIGLSRIPVVGIEQVHFRKPNPEIFLKTAKMLGAKPSQCVVFEDSLPGITAAKRAKMKIVALLTTTPKARLKKLKPDLLIRNYNLISVSTISRL
ncbi:HAD family phosphatase [Candidatus Woesearchaeota archaeon]|nr:HAD family phosphatase [Candidatus Woesearchaeota archaeon]